MPTHNAMSPNGREAIGAVSTVNGKFEYLKTTNGILQTSATIGGSAIPITGATTGVGVAILDGSGNQITSFGGGTQYAELVTTAPGTGTLSLGRYKSSAPTLTDGQMYGLQLDSSGNLKVTSTGGSAGTQYAELTTTAPGTGTLALGRYKTTAPVLTDGQLYSPQLDANANLLTVPSAYKVSGSFTTNGQTLVIGPLNGAPYVMFNFSSAGSMTVVFEASDDASFTIANLVYAVGHINTSSITTTTQSTSIASVGTTTRYLASTYGFQYFRLRVSAYSSGTPTVNIIAQQTPIFPYMPVVANPSDGSSAFTAGIGVPHSMAAQSTYNGSTYDILRSVVNGTNSTGTGIVAAGSLAQFDDTTPTSITENQFGNLRISANRNLYGTIRDAAGNERGVNVNASNQMTVSINDSLGNSTNSAGGGFLTVSDEPKQVFYDPFDASPDTVNMWTSTTGSSGVAASVTTGVLSMGTGTVANGYSKFTSIPTFKPVIPGWVVYSDAILIPDAASPTANALRLWGVGTTPGTPTFAAPATDGYFFELSGSTLSAVVYAGGVRTQIATGLTLATTYQRYIVKVRTDRTFFFIGTIDSAGLVATTNFQSPQIQTLPKLFLAVGNSTPPGSNSQIQCTGAVVSDTGKNATLLADGTFPWRRATVKPASTAPLTTDPALVVAVSPNSIVTSVNSELADVTGTITNATQTTPIVASGLAGYDNVLVSINGTYTGATAIFQGSDDGGTTWYNTAVATRTDSPTIEAGYTTLTSTTRAWNVNIQGFDSFRVNPSAVATGTVNVRISAESAPTNAGATVQLGAALPVGANAIGSITNTSFAATQATAASLNATVVGTGTFAVQATLAAETTKVIGTVNQGTSPWVTSNATTSVVGNGAAATAQRFTLANDSTGVIATVGTVTTLTGTTTLTPGTGATNLGKAEDAVHASGDTGVMSLGVANEALINISGTDGDYTPIGTDRNGTVHVAQKAGTGTLSNVAGSATSVTLLAANAARIGAQISNDSSAVLYIKFGTTASTTSYTVSLSGQASAPFSYYEVPAGYTGRIDGIWASATGNSRVTEETP